MAPPDREDVSVTSSETSVNAPVEHTGSATMSMDTSIV